MWCMKSRFFVLLPSRGEVLRVSPRPRLVGGREGSEGPGGGLGGENSLAGRPPPTRHWLCSPSWGLASAGAARRPPPPHPAPRPEQAKGWLCLQQSHRGSPGGGRAGLGRGQVGSRSREGGRGQAGEAGSSRGGYLPGPRGADPLPSLLSPPPPPAGAHSAFTPPTALPPWSAT